VAATPGLGDRFRVFCLPEYRLDRGSQGALAGPRMPTQVGPYLSRPLSHRHPYVRWPALCAPDGLLLTVQLVLWPPPIGTLERDRAAAGEVLRHQLRALVPGGAGRRRAAAAGASSPPTDIPSVPPHPAQSQVSPIDLSHPPPHWSLSPNHRFLSQGGGQLVASVLTLAATVATCFLWSADVLRCDPFPLHLS